ncbi:hypothetical protein [Nocardia sp. NPDC049149]|uniref:hypothetical protein n=1 Tax=Nocardia sp. NPDC049149 TaxID=3364315 RepID=UPI00371EBC95
MVSETTRVVPPPDNALVAVVKRRWPTLLGIGVVLAAAAVRPEGSRFAIVALIAAAVAYPLFGIYRRHLHGRNVLLAQAVALLAFVGLAAVVLFVDDPLGRVLLAVGFLAHGAWDVWHHRADRMVPRWYAELCAVVDVLAAVALVLVPLV